MTTSREAELDILREQLTSDQRDIIKTIWVHFRDQNRWIPRAALHDRLGPAAGGAALKPLLGTIVLDCEEGGEQFFRLTFLGVLLADQGRESEELLARYLEYVRDRVKLDPTVEWVTSYEVEAALGLNPDRSRTLQQLIRLSHWWGGGGGFAEREWTVGVPIDVDDLTQQADLRAYIRDHVVSHYLPAICREGAASAAGRAAPRSAFWFVADPALGHQLALDWHEAQDVYQVRGWKSCVILAGGILEGMLLDALRRARPTRRRPSRRKTPPPPRPSHRWSLAALVDAAVRRRLLQRGSLDLGPAVREYRSLIHPQRQIDQTLEVTRDDADRALEAVQSCLRQLAGCESRTQDRT